MWMDVRSLLVKCSPLVVVRGMNCLLVEEWLIIEVDCVLELVIS